VTQPGLARPDDEGSVLVLMLGLVVVLVLLVGVVVDVSALVLSRRSLASTADGAAVSAAQGLDYGRFYADGPAAGVPLSGAVVAERVATYAEGATQDQPGLQLQSRVDDGYVAVVTATRTVRLPFGRGLGIADVVVTAEARARAPLLVGP
jgi:Flp pilus assembly protein TadG